MRVVKNFYFLECLSQSKTKQQRELILDWATKEHLKTVCELMLNIRAGNIDLPEELYLKLKKHRKAVRILSNKFNNKHKLELKRNILKNSKGLIDVLPAILSLVKITIPDFHQSLLFLQDYMRRKEILSTTNVRKVFNCGGFGGEALFLVVVGYTNSRVSE